MYSPYRHYAPSPWPLPQRIVIEVDHSSPSPVQPTTRPLQAPYFEQDSKIAGWTTSTNESRIRENRSSVQSQPAQGKAEFMDTPDPTSLLTAARDGDVRAADQLMPIVYEELRAIAAVLVAREHADSGLQATAIVHEAYLRLVDQTRVAWKDSVHFRRVAATIMRRVLVDEARQRDRLKRGGHLQRVTLTTNIFANTDSIDLLELDDLIETLAAEDERSAATVVYRFFGGLTLEETAATLDVSSATVERDWQFARTWLYRHLFPRDDVSS